MMSISSMFYPCPRSHREEYASRQTSSVMPSRSQRSRFQTLPSVSTIPIIKGQVKKKKRVGTCHSLPRKLFSRSIRNNRSISPRRQRAVPRCVCRRYRLDYRRFRVLQCSVSGVDIPVLSARDVRCLCYFDSSAFVLPIQFTVLSHPIRPA